MREHASQIGIELGLWCYFIGGSRVPKKELAFTVLYRVWWKNYKIDGI